MARQLSVIKAVNTPSVGSLHEWLDIPAPGASWMAFGTVDLGPNHMVIAWGGEADTFAMLLARTQQVEAALNNPASTAGVTWPNVVVIDSTPDRPILLPGDPGNPIWRVVPSVFTNGGGPGGPNTRLNVYWSPVDG